MVGDFDMWVITSTTVEQVSHFDNKDQKSVTVEGYKSSIVETTNGSTGLTLLLLKASLP